MNTLKKRKYSNILLLVVTILIMLFVVEGLFRLREYYRTSIGGSPNYIYYRHKYLGIALKPNRDFYGRIKINSLGFRNEEISYKKNKDTVRIFAVGGSTTFDTYVSSNEKTWVYQLAERLQKYYPKKKFEVINAGVPGYKLIQSTINLLLRILDLKPDFIILYHSHNEITKNWKESWKENNFLAFRNKNVGIIEDFLEQHSIAFVKLRGALRDLFRKFVKNKRISRQRYDEPEARLVNKYERDLKIFIEICKANGIKTILPSAVVGYRKSMPIKEQKEVAKTSLHFFSGLTLKGLYKSYLIYNDKIREVANETQSIYIDLQGKIPGGLKYFPDGIHFSDSGTSIMAKVLSEEIFKSNIILEAASFQKQF